LSPVPADAQRALVNAKGLKAILYGLVRSGRVDSHRSEQNRLRIQLEMGGKNPTIVLADADFNSASPTPLLSFFSTGQEVAKLPAA
jgi:aldehyde dehydrogenase (NAD+)